MHAPQTTKPTPPNYARLLSYLAVFLQGLAFWRTPLYDPDLGWHLVGGAWVDSFGEVPRRDIINVFNPTWLDYHWLGQWLIYQFYELLSWPGVQMVCGLTVGAFALILYRVIEISTPNKSPGEHLTLAGLYLTVLFGMFSTRPTSIAFVLVMFGWLLVLRRGHHALPWLLLLGVITANMHVYWTFLAIIWGVYVCVPHVLRRKGRYDVSSFTCWGGLFALLAVGLISPYGLLSSLPGGEAKFENYFVFLDVALNPAQLKPIISELRGGFSVLSPFLWATIAIFLLIAKHYSARRLAARAPSVLFLLGTLFMAVESIKYAPFFLTASLPLVAPAFCKTLRQIRANQILRFAPPALCLGLFIYAFITSPFRAANAEQAWNDLKLDQPIEACRKVKELFPNPIRPVVIGTMYDKGGWCSWQMKGDNLLSSYWVTMDGRTQLVPAKDIIDGIGLYAGKPGWEQTLAKWNPDALVVQKGQPLGSLLRGTGRWNLVHTDVNFGLFVKE